MQLLLSRTGEQRAGVELNLISTSGSGICSQVCWELCDAAGKAKSARFPLSSPAALTFCKKPHLCFGPIIVSERENQTRARAGGEESPERINTCSWVPVPIASATCGHLPEPDLQQSKSITNLVWGKGRDKHELEWGLSPLVILIPYHRPSSLGKRTQRTSLLPFATALTLPSFKGKPKQRSTAPLQKFTKSFT